MQPLILVQTSMAALPAVHLSEEGECRADPAVFELYDCPPVAEAAMSDVVPVLLPCHLPATVIPIASGDAERALTEPAFAGTPAVATAGDLEPEPDIGPDGTPADVAASGRTLTEVSRLPLGAFEERPGPEPAGAPEEFADVRQAKADRARPESPVASPMPDALLTDRMAAHASADGELDTGWPGRVMPPAFQPADAVPAGNGQLTDQANPTGPERPKVGAALDPDRVPERPVSPEVRAAVEAAQAEAAPVRPFGPQGNDSAGDSTRKSAAVEGALPTGREGPPAKRADPLPATDDLPWPTVATEDGPEAKVFPVKDAGPDPKAVPSPVVVWQPGPPRVLDAGPALAPASIQPPTRAETLWHMAVGPLLDLPGPDAVSIPESPPTPTGGPVDTALRSRPVPWDLAPAALEPLGLSAASADDMPQGPGPLLPGATQPPTSTVSHASLSQAPGALVSQLATTVVDSLSHTPEGVTEIRLSPEELGTVRVTLRTDAANPDRVVVMLSFDRPDTLDLFRRHAEQLTDALRLAGYSQADISFGQHGAGQTPFGRSGPDQGATGAEGSGDDQPDPDPSLPAGRAAIRQPGLSATSLDLRL